MARANQLLKENQKHKQTIAKLEQQTEESCTYKQQVTVLAEEIDSHRQKSAPLAAENENMKHDVSELALLKKESKKCKHETEKLAKENEKLRQGAAKLNKEAECPVCMENMAMTVLVPCGNVCVYMYTCIICIFVHNIHTYIHIYKYARQIS